MSDLRKIAEDAVAGIGPDAEDVIDAARDDTAQAVAIERNMTAMWLDKLGDDEMWADIATRYHLAAEAVRNGEHVKEEA